MKLLVIGSGGREHALVWKLAQSRHITRMWCAPGNAGIGEERLAGNGSLVECVKFAAEELAGREDMLLANVFVEIARAHARGQWRVRTDFGHSAGGGWFRLRRKQIVLRHGGRLVGIRVEGKSALKLEPKPEIARKTAEKPLEK